MRRLIHKAIVGDQRGALLAEALIAVSVFTLLGSAVMTSMSATGAASERIQTRATADTLASNQLTAILSAVYQDPPYTYTPLTPPSGYTVTAEALEFVPGDTNIAKIVVIVSRAGKPAATLESLRLKGG